MALVSMAIKPEPPVPQEASPYGYGLRIQLDEDRCEALGIKTPPAAGARVMLTAAAYVCSATQHVEDDGDDAGPDVYLELQITDLELRGATDGDARTLYPKSLLK